ncbi:CRISPR-associated helicase Cas3' [Cetobacterium somerae]|uniref:CRISPR-associated helicase Cas3' n=1 Tax=Cetobacterium sp. NK01 TaxID=2993530 RepID=UPI0021162288|nr:CRISPR-associated helicase Cas3' [Cetobacterium sp. NK01]MCQ8213453.1 CRISPR-associated helicase Cas3' [Cetobacterium sp. NK01]
MFSFVDNFEKFYAHISKERVELLKDHIYLTEKYVKKIIHEKNLEEVINNLGHSFFKDKKDFEFWKNMFFDTIIFHDIGKINENFQIFKMKNKNFKKKENFTTNHSPLSTKIYFDYYIDNVLESHEDMLIFLFLNMYIISKHHGSLDEFMTFLNSFLDSYEDLKDKRDSLFNLLKLDDTGEDISQVIKWLQDSLKCFEKNDWDFLNLYIYVKLLYSLLVSADFYSTSEFMNKSPIEDIGLLKNVNPYLDNFKNTKVFEGINKYKNFKENKEENPFKNIPINVLRSELFLESQYNLEKNLDSNIYFLEAPTGSGKTICSINLAFNLLKQNQNLNKLFYIFPFNTLVEQTGESLKDILGIETYNKDVSIINSITPLFKESESEIKLESGEKIDYEKFLLDRQFIHSPIVLTTHVNFFNYLFGLDRESHFPLFQIANSIVIIDEIQAYKNNIWKEIAIFLNYFSKVLNIKFIIMSATLPKIDDLIDCSLNKTVFTPLISNINKYYQNELFSKRVEIDYSFLEDLKKCDNSKKLKLLKDSVIENYNENKKIVVEFIKKKTAFEFFKLLLDENINLNLELLTGDDNKVERKEIISKIKNENSPIILISTQVIEAGVDIDMDVGYKNISILDSEEQFLGRVNRSCKKSGKVYFFEIDKPKDVYKNDVRSDYENTLNSDKIKKILINKDFKEYYNQIIASLNKEAIKMNTKNIDKFKKDSLFTLNFKNISERLKLIEKREDVSIFLNREINIDNKTIKGYEVWHEYKELLENNAISYSEKRVKLSNLMEKMDYFIYKVKTLNKSYSDNIGNIFYIENTTDYFIEFNGKMKFNREKFEGEKSFIEFL